MKSGKAVGFVFIILAVFLILALVVLGGGLLGKKIVADVPVKRGVADVFIAQPLVKVRQGGFFEMQPYGLWGWIVPEKPLRLIMYVDGSKCDEVDLELDYLETKTKTLSCPAEQGEHDVLIKLYDEKGLEDTYKSSITVR